MSSSLCYLTDSTNDSFELTLKLSKVISPTISCFRGKSKTSIEFAFTEVLSIVVKISPVLLHGKNV